MLRHGEVGMSCYDAIKGATIYKRYVAPSSLHSKQWDWGNPREGAGAGIVESKSPV